ncbi:hypothetical protein [Bacillus sp. EB600]|uniref:hypothetical protein n=1 Tax=Bacillus sp. EB600 TaxID=2806345 RepID=UPI00210A7F95|nr:hypothetical protein [Bacillus sp. EB600]MCQ6282086.1 hypothetical protein [Bacillus sp. EB600]
MFDKSDPRATLIQTKEKKKELNGIAAADYGKFYEQETTETDGSTKTWWMRGQNFFISYSDATDGAEFKRLNQVDEYVLLLPDKESEAEVRWANSVTIVDGLSIAFIPGGESEIKVTKGGKVIRLFSTENKDLKDLPFNKESYSELNPHVALLEPWPEPTDGYKVRVYSLDVPKEEGRFGRIFRCSTFMVNFLDPNDGPRDPSKMSPHSHDDFEQCSLAIEGEFVHHLRWPWTTNMADWRPDDHELCPSPSVAVIPPGAVHTTQATGSGINQLIDIFCPPRVDFSEKDGWVLNADEYPMPEA